jgi:two-component sensor histidine kinase
MEKAKMSPWSFPRVAIISKAAPLSGTPNLFSTRRVESIHRRKEFFMNKTWKKIFFLDFEESFLSSSGKLVLVWNPLWTLVVTVFLGNHSLASILFRWGWNFLEATIVCFLGLVAIRVYLFAERGWASRASKNPPRHGTGWYMLFLAFLAPPALFVALRVMVGGINFFYAGEPIAPTFQWQYYGTEIFWVWSLLLICFLFKSWQDLRDSAQRNQLRAEELEKERLQAVLTKLKDQMNPHFLFNTLNTVASLIPADPVRAEQVVVKLSALFQGILTATRKTHHPLEKELEFCRDYMEIEKTRFGSRLKTFITIEKGLDPARILMPVLLLQPLVENAVKHGLSSRATGGHLWINARLNNGKTELRVEDDGVGFGNSPYAGSGTALENCRKRLELGFGKEGKMEIVPREGGGTTVLLVLPAINADLSAEAEK